MDLIFEIILDLIIEVSVQKIINKKMPKLVRCILLSLLLTFFLSLTLLIIWIGTSIIKDNLIGGIIIISFGLIIIILSILRFRRIYMSRKKE